MQQWCTFFCLTLGLPMPWISLSEPSLRASVRGIWSWFRHRSEVYLPLLALWESIEMDQLRINGYQPIRGRFWSWSVGEGTSVCGHRLELSTGVVVGFCYHKAADLRVRQAAHSLPCVSCIRSCFAWLSSVNRLPRFEHHLTALHVVWSLTGVGGVFTASRLVCCVWVLIGFFWFWRKVF